MPTAAETSARHLEECLTFYRFPNEASALVMAFSLLEEDGIKWQKVGMKADDCLAGGGIKGFGAGVNQTGILRGNTGCLKGDWLR